MIVGVTEEAVDLAVGGVVGNRGPSARRHPASTDVSDEFLEGSEVVFDLGEKRARWLATMPAQMREIQLVKNLPVGVERLLELEGTILAVRRSRL